MKIKRGEVVICVFPKDVGKPRPAVVVQSDLFNETHSSITVCPVTSHTKDCSLFRLDIKPTKVNGLQTPSQVMIDKLMSIRTNKIRESIGHLTTDEVTQVNNALSLWLNL